MRTTRIKILLIVSLILLSAAESAGAQVECRSDRGGYCVNVGAISQAQVNQAVPGLEFLQLPQGAQPGVLISRIYTFGLGLVGISALLMFIWSGVEYMIARDKEPADAKKRMGNAVFGLLLALLSWVLLNTINPKLVRTLDLGLTKLELKPIPTIPTRSSRDEIAAQQQKVEEVIAQNQESEGKSVLESVIQREDEGHAERAIELQNFQKKCTEKLGGLDQLQQTLLDDGSTAFSCVKSECDTNVFQRASDTDNQVCISRRYLNERSIRNDDDLQKCMEVVQKHNTRVEEFIKKGRGRGLKKVPIETSLSMVGNVQIRFCSLQFKIVR